MKPGRAVWVLRGDVNNHHCHCVWDLKSTIALLCTMLSKADLALPVCATGAFLLAKCCSGNAGVPRRNISSVSLWHYCLFPHQAPVPVRWYLLGLSLSVLVRFVTLTTERLDKNSSHSKWVMQLWAHAFTPSTKEKPAAETGFSKENIPQESCLEFLPFLPTGENHKFWHYPSLIPRDSGKWAGYCVWATLSWLHLLSWAFSGIHQSYAMKMYYLDIPGERLSKRLRILLFGLTATRNHSSHCCDVEWQLIVLRSHSEVLALKYVQSSL